MNGIIPDCLILNYWEMLFDDMKTCKERGRMFGYREEILFDTIL
jgi:hypothetical protein